MKRILPVAAAAAFAFSLALTAHAADKKTYGSGVSAPDTVKVSELVANPDKYVGKTVRIEGVVTDVCPKRGCWMDVAGDKEFQTVRIKVEDGVIVFPLEAKGKHAVAEGVFTVRQMSREDAVAYLQHVAEEKKQPFDPASVKGPMTIYMLKGTGAVID